MGIEPESNHASSTGSTRRELRLPHSVHVSTMSSTYGRCRSRSSSGFAASSLSSATDPTHVSWPQSPQRQTGIGVPQNRSRLSAQSTLFSSQSPNRPCLMCSGCQVICSFSRSSESLIADVRANQVGFAQ